jgi:hypothetical protein
VDAGTRCAGAELVVQTTLRISGILILLVGIGWPWISKLPLGRLPGDIVVDRENFRFYFPLTTMIVLSLVLSAIAWLLRKW